MRIIVWEVRREHNTLYVDFNPDLTFRTPEGRRALRVLRMYTSGGHSIEYSVFRMHLRRTDDVRAIDTRAKCQTVMDFWANAPVTVTFEKPHIQGIAARQKVNVLRNRAAVQAALDAGRTIQVNVGFRLNLPMLHDDIEALEKIVPGEIFHDNNDPYRMVIQLYLQDKRTNPWNLLRELKPKIQAAIV